jgi:hypothetical protein
MVLYNDPQRYVAPDVYHILLNNDIIGQLFKHVPVQGSNTREYQFTLAAYDQAPYISEQWGKKPENVEFIDAKARSDIIQKDAQLHREQYLNLAGPRGTRKQVIAKLFAYSIMQGKEEMAFMGAGSGVLPTGYQNGLFNLVSDATSSIAKPADCCSTAGTATAASSYTGAAKTTDAHAVDLTAAFKELEAEGFIVRTQGTTTEGGYTKHIFLNQLAWETFRQMPPYDGAQSYDRTYAEALRADGYTIVTADIIDSDYDGADDSTTEMMEVVNIKENFVIGVIQVPKQEPWQEAMAAHGFEYWCKFWTEQVQFAVPYDNGTYYKKAVHQSKIKPYDTA